MKDIKDCTNLIQYAKELTATPTSQINNKDLIKSLKDDGFNVQGTSKKEVDWILKQLFIQNLERNKVYPVHSLDAIYSTLIHNIEDYSKNFGLNKYDIFILTFLTALSDNSLFKNTD